MTISVENESISGGKKRFDVVFASQDQEQFTVTCDDELAWDGAAFCDPYHRSTRTAIDDGWHFVLIRKGGLGAGVVVVAELVQPGDVTAVEDDVADVVAGISNFETVPATSGYTLKANYVSEFTETPVVSALDPKLPAVAASAGKWVTCKKIAVTDDLVVGKATADSANIIDGQSSYTITGEYGHAAFFSNGVTWQCFPAVA